MKLKLLYRYLVVGIFTLFAASCEKDIMSYEGKEGVYFAVRHGSSYLSEDRWPYQPYSTVDFVRLGVQEIDWELEVAITGPVKAYDREFFLEVNPDSTTAVAEQHYRVPNRTWTIPAGATSTKISVHILRSSDLLDESRVLGLRLVASEDFELSFPEWDAIPSLTGGTVVPHFDASLHSIVITDVMSQPAVWSGSIQAGNRESGLFGVFTRRKMEFMEEHLGVTYQDFSDAESMPMARMMLLAQDGADVLVRYFNEGRPILEEDGRLMWMGTVPWTTYIGVPYVPQP